MTNYVCPNGHKVSAPYALERCPLTRCQERLQEVGPNFGPLKDKATSK